jgi:EAL domain-containing protein (putative c-di-GMP-specific phosphodiesterase class I)
MHAEAVAIWQLETDLRAAIEHHEFQVHYQPIVFLPTGNLAGFEALLRWQHPRRGLLYPDEFLSVAEETGLIVPIGRWVLWEACRQMRAWQDEWPVQPPLFVSVNLGNREFAQIDLIEQIDGALRETGFDPYYLRLEVTETVLIENTQTASAVLTRLRDRGIRLSIDDFGTGYSSLSYLHRFPFDTLKIDRSFIQRLGSSNDSLEVVRAVVTLAHNLGMKVVAEGHETSQQLDRLKELDCEYVQGYFFSKPLDRHAAAALLEAGIEGQPVGLSARSRAAVPSG